MVPGSTALNFAVRSQCSQKIPVMLQGGIMHQACCRCCTLMMAVPCVIVSWRSSKFCVHVCSWEKAYNSQGVELTRPVVRVEVGGRPLIFTRIDPANRKTSVLLRLRPNWWQLKDYLSGMEDVRAGMQRRQRCDVRHDLWPFTVSYRGFGRCCGSCGCEAAVCQWQGVCPQLKTSTVMHPHVVVLLQLAQNQHS